MRDHLQNDSPLPNLSESPLLESWIRLWTKKAYILYVDISDFTGKPVKRDGFNDPRGGLADVNVSENHVWSLLFHKVILSLENFGKTLRKVHFCITIMARKSMKDSYALKGLFQSKVLRHPNSTELRSFLYTLLLMTSIFVTA